MSDDARTRRLKADFEAMQRLLETSTILEFSSYGNPPEKYLVTFHGSSLKRASEDESVEPAESHQVEIELGADYPRNPPRVKFLTGLYHPNVSLAGQVWFGPDAKNKRMAPFALDQFCETLWDLVRFARYDEASPNHVPALKWLERQKQFKLPTDPRPLRDRPQS